ncbi:hypothetical protein [Flavobacterium oreochromis]|uniref:Uncharacterized protein n=2 Tax=Flavobacterium TaxID=237 RepID=A0A246GC66_9FLAO|nr:hypothetical protein [Flavobacterium oreochromis]OWP77892.1 hypothetical protein BWG23_03710 [Flavobacterium oreochromis]OWP78610.1 hypothetical protein BWK62_04635 [Flavobacterium oreochromis]POR30617.1 hypothetical protein BWK58_01120 [Flavobacterium columnare]QYS85615.1 hypothetical protein JJC03_10395 [Flavobacterium oreochromis]
MKFLKNKFRLSNKIKNEIEIERNLVTTSAKIASQSAIRTSKALGLSIKSIDNGKLIETHPNGNIVVIRELIKVAPKTPDIRKGISICLK